MYELLEQLLDTGYFANEVSISNNKLYINLTFIMVKVNDDVLSSTLGIPYNHLEKIIKIIGDKQYYILCRNEEIILTIKNKPKQ